MRSLFLLATLSLLAFAQELCQCPQVKCPANDPIQLCQCLNAREKLCATRCPPYLPTYLPCPIAPQPTDQPESCTCDSIMCPMVWPQSCHCENNVKQKCHEKCGGLEPTYQQCPDASSPLLSPAAPPPPHFTPTPAPTHTVTIPPHPSKTTPTSKPSGTHAVCGGGRGNWKTCAEGYTCISDPFVPGCGIECDGPGICVEDKMCGGIAAFSCETRGQVCMDDPRDDCDPKDGGWDCAGLCVWRRRR